MTLRRQWKRHLPLWQAFALQAIASGILLWPCETSRDDPQPLFHSALLSALQLKNLEDPHFRITTFDATSLPISLQGAKGCRKARCVFLHDKAALKIIESSDGGHCNPTNQKYRKF